MSEVTSLNGRHCRNATKASVSSGYYYTVVASFIDDQTGLWCAVISRTGGTNVLRFVELEFDPDEPRPVR